MEATMSLNAFVRLPLSSSKLNDKPLVRHSRFSAPVIHSPLQRCRRHRTLLVEAKGRKGMYRRPLPPPLPKIEDDGNPKFVIFIRSASMYLWYPLSIVSGGTTAKIMISAKDNFLGKYIYKDTLDRNLAAVIYRDEKEIQKTAVKTHPILRNTTSGFRYGYKLIENGNVRSALSSSNVIELPTKDKLKTVLDRVKDFFGDAKESFGKITTLNFSNEESKEEDTADKSKV